MQRGLGEISTQTKADQDEPSTEMIKIEESSSHESYDEKIRALIYTTCYNVLDGVTITIRKLEREILAAGGSVCIVTTTSGNSENTHLVEPHENRKVIFMDNSIPIPFQSDPNDPSVSYHIGISLSKKIQQEMDEFKPNIIHITAPDFTALHVHNYARKRQIPLMGTYHSNIADYVLFVPGLSFVKPIIVMFFRHIYNFLFRLYVPTPFIKQMLIDEQKMDQVTNLGVWGRGVDLKRFKPENRSESFRQKLGVDPECPIVLYVGRLVPEKRPDIIATVVKRLTAQNVKFACVIVGAGPAEHLIENLPNTHHLGWLNGDQLTEAYASSDIFLFPSSVETFGNVTLEAAASGLPLVVEEKCSGHLVDHEQNGYACEAGNVEKFFQGTLELCKNAEKRTLFSKNSIAKSKTLEQSVVVRQMLDNYKEVQKEFYDEFGGNHYNRDAAFDHKGSFVIGMDPRPTGWFLLEFVLLSALRLANFLIGMASRCHCCNKESYEAVETDEEAQISSPTQSVNEDDETKGPGFICRIFVAIGDSPLTAQLVMLFIGIFLFFCRIISRIRRCFAKRLCSKNFQSIEHRMNAAFATSKIKH